MFFHSAQTKRRTTWFAALAIMLGAGALLLHAFNPQPDPPKVFGILGITSADVLRLHVTNVGSAVGVPPGTCVAQIGFVNAAGQTIKTAEVKIADGHSASIALTFSEATGSDTTGAFDAATLQASVRPVINVAPPDPCFTAVSTEIADAATGRTRVYAMPQLWSPAAASN